MRTIFKISTVLFVGLTLVVSSCKKEDKFGIDSDVEVEISMISWAGDGVYYGDIGHTNLSVEDLKLTRPSLSTFFVKYNKAKDPNFTHETKSIKVKTRLAVFGGLSNSIFTSNPTNAIAPVAGVDFENYIYTISPQTEITDSLLLIDNVDAIRQIAYFDGLGRAKQNISYKVLCDYGMVVRKTIELYFYKYIVF